MKNKILKFIKSNKKLLLILTPIIIIVIAVLAAVMSPKEQRFSEEIVKTQDIETYYSFTGNIEAEDSQKVFSKNMLPIKTIYVKEGESVKKGQALFAFDGSNLAASVEQSSASLEIAKINYEKARTTSKSSLLLQAQIALDTAQNAYNTAKTNLDNATAAYNNGSITASELAAAQAAFDSAQYQLSNAQQSYNIAAQTADQNISIAREQLNQAQANYDNIQQQIKDLTVKAEINGVVSDITAKENQTLALGSPIMNVVNYDTLIVTVKVDEYDLSAVSVGKEVSLNVNALDLQIGGVISKISKQATVVNGVSFFPTKITIDDNENLRVGMSCEIKIINKSVKGVTAISMKALQFDNYNEPYVYYRDEKGNVATKKVTAGINDGNTVQIIDGLQSGDVILVPVAANFNPFNVVSN